MPDERIVHVVDDDPAFLCSVEVLLESAGFATRACDSALAVLNAASQLSGGCMLLDIRMPGMNGLEVQARLNELGIRLPVIVMTPRHDTRRIRSERCRIAERNGSKPTLSSSASGCGRGPRSANRPD